jgi:hypothetical protein
MSILRALGVDCGRLIVAPSAGVKTNRTFESALALRRALARRGIQLRGLNLMRGTIGSTDSILRVGLVLVP